MAEKHTQMSDARSKQKLHPFFAEPFEATSLHHSWLYGHRRVGFPTVLMGRVS